MLLSATVCELAHVSHPYHSCGSVAEGLYCAVLVTGPSLNGIGASTLEALAKAHPQTLILAGRRPSAFERVAQRIVAAQDQGAWYKSASGWKGKCGKERAV